MRNLRSVAGVLLIALTIVLTSAALIQADSVVVLVTTLVGSPGSRGSANGAGAAARFSDPSGMALSADGTIAVVADTANQTIRRLGMMIVTPRVRLPLVAR